MGCNVRERISKWRKALIKPGPGGHRRKINQILLVTGLATVMVLIIGAMVSPLWAQPYPNKPIRLILPYPPGGAVDTVGRIVGLKLAERLGQPVVCENRPGAGSHVGTEFVAKAKPDGYTIVLATTALTIGPGLYRKLHYDALRDLAPITIAAQGHFVLTSRPTLPVRDLKEFIDYARANPGKLNYGSTGIGAPPHLSVELLKSLTKIDMLHIPYKGAGPVMIGLMAGEIDMAVCSIAGALPHIRAGKVRALAVPSNERSPLLPDVPTAKEIAIEDLEVTSWYGILAPAGTPREIIHQLNAEWAKIAAMPDTREKMEKIGLEPISITPEKFSEIIRTEIARWAKVIKEAKIPTID